MLAALTLAVFAVALPGIAAASAEMPTVTFVRAWGGLGEAPGQFDMPIGIAISGTDELFVTDHYNDRIQRFDTEGKLLAVLPTRPNPSGIAADAAGNLYVSHFAATKVGMNKPNASTCIVVYAADGRVIREWGRQGTGEGEFDCPGGVAVGKDGRVYVADQTNHRVQVFDQEGKFLLKWGEYGNAPGQFGGMDAVYSRTGGPQFLALDASGSVWTTEGLNCRIQQFTGDGAFIRAWGDAENQPGHLGGFFTWTDGKPSRLQGAVGICVDNQDRIWVSAVSGRVQLFSQDGTYIAGVGEGQGSGPGQFIVPHGIALDSKGHLFVVDAMNHRVQQFAVKE